MPTPNYVFSSVCETPEESGEFGEGLDRSYTRNYEAFLDLNQSTSADITVLQAWEQLAIQLPRYGDIWVSRDGSRTDELSVMRKFRGGRDRQDKSKFKFTFNYTPRGPSSNDARSRNIGGGTDNLENLWPDWSLSSEEKLWPLEARVDAEGKVRFGVDLDNKKVVNSAGDIYDPQPMLHNAVITLDYSRIEKNMTNQTASQIMVDQDNYLYRTNADQFLFDANVNDDKKKWLCTMYRVKPENLGPYRVMRREMQFKYYFKGWDTWLLDAGLYEVKQDLNEQYEMEWGFVSGWAITNKKQILHPTTRSPVTRPWPLDGRGKAIADMNNAMPRWNKFRFRDSVNFAALGVILV